jgi:predicted nucleotidyltransferase
MIAEDAIAAVERHRNVDRVCLVGSRAAGSANAFSD